MKNAALFLTFIVALMCGHLYSCSSGTTQTEKDSSTGTDKDTADVQLAEPDFNDFLNCFEKCSLPYPDNFSDVSEKEIPESLVRTYIFSNNKSIEHDSGSGILLSKGRFDLPEDRVGTIFSESNPDHSEKSTWLFIYDSGGSFRCSYQLDYSYRGAASRDNTSSEISRNLHILTITASEEKDLVSDEWISTKESFHYMINDDGWIVDASYE